MSPVQRFQVGEWIVHPDLNQIEKGEISRQIEPKVMDVLCFFARHAGEVLTRERILHAVSPNTYVGYEALARSISELRRAMGDDAHSPLYIETIPRRGYRLIAEVVFPQEDIEFPADHFKILEKIGEDRIGESFLAKDTALNRKVILKLLLPEKEMDRVQLLHLQREARAIAALNHPYICKVYEIGRTSGRSFIAMEYVEGEKLSTRLQRGPVPVKEAIRIALEVSEALADAHHSGIVHRNISPSCLILSNLGHIKITGFGIAKKFRKEKENWEEWSLTTSTDKTFETGEYMSPEQIMEEPVDHRADLFLFGLVLYTMIAGTHPFKKKSPIVTSAAILHEDPLPLSRFLVHNHSSVVESVLLKMLEKEPGSRYQTVNEITEDLLRIQQKLEKPKLWDSFLRFFHRQRSKAD